MSTTNKLSQDELREIATKALELEREALFDDYERYCVDQMSTLAQAVLDQSAEIERLRAALEHLLFWNKGILEGRGNYRPRDHINLIEEAPANQPKQQTLRGLERRNGWEIISPVNKTFFYCGFGFQKNLPDNRTNPDRRTGEKK